MTPADAFDVVVPSLPGYGFSGKPSATGWDIHRIARAWAELMARLGYGRFLAMGSDWGTSVSTSLALQHPGRLLGIHLVPPLAPPGRAASDLTDDERAALADLDQRGRTGSGYSAVQGTRPQTIGYSLTDSPAGLERQAWSAAGRPGGDGCARGSVPDSAVCQGCRARGEGRAGHRAGKFDEVAAFADVGEEQLCGPIAGLMRRRWTSSQRESRARDAGHRAPDE